MTDVLLDGQHRVLTQHLVLSTQHYFQRSSSQQRVKCCLAGYNIAAVECIPCKPIALSKSQILNACYHKTQ
jgi:hypothetical protein